MHSPGCCQDCCGSSVRWGDEGLTSYSIPALTLFLVTASLHKKGDHDPERTKDYPRITEQIKSQRWKWPPDLGFTQGLDFGRLHGL